MQNNSLPEPWGSVLTSVFVFGSVVSDLSKLNDYSQLLLNIVLILVGILTGTNYIIKITKELKNRENETKQEPNAKRGN